MKRKILLVLVVALCAIGVASAMGVKEGYELPGTPVPFAIVINKGAASGYPKEAADLASAVYRGEIVIAKELAGKAAKMTKGLERNFVVVATEEEALQAVSRGEFAVAVLPEGTKAPKGTELVPLTK